SLTLPASCAHLLILVSISTLCSSSLSLTPLSAFTHPFTTEPYTLSLHDALPISWPSRRTTRCGPRTSTCRPSSSPTASSRRCRPDRKSTRLNSSHQIISYAVFCLKKKNEYVTG